MADKISFDLVSPEQLLLSDAADMVTIPGSDGDMGVMAGHAPLITTLRPGIIKVAGATGGEDSYFVAGGFAEVNAEKITVLAEEAVPVKGLDIEARLTLANEAVTAARSDADKAKAQEIVDALAALRSVH
ncbi:F-type H+-transporting ATPase subunit epsilon [Rhizomicrobium palustre]|uniref:ATP synthase epsilon chain n=1 Tax=Rhizomicrobium palustre TaxID=189966 RepID=A0A846N4H3_9PROT|nr:F0F1 ATP synthase subunit epsilon [Rhizomicrobium palustre]NIK90092.1 F-type H+-transporting ATPase subunit epsilon [Rhizomicrobium palustre]